MNTFTLKVASCLDKVRVIAKDKYPKQFEKVDQTFAWTINDRLRTCAGKAKFKIHPVIGYMGGTIEFSSYILSKVSDEELYDTVSHEYAHLIAATMGEYGHGYEWKYAHKALGGSGNQFHNYKTACKVNTKKRIVISKNGHDYQMSIQKFNKVGYDRIVACGYTFKKIIQINSDKSIVELPMEQTMKALQKNKA